MFLLSIYGVAKTLVAQYEVLRLKSWSGAVGAIGATDQTVALFTGTGQNLVGSSLQNFVVANTYEETKFWLVRQAGVQVGALFKPEQIKVYKFNATMSYPKPTAAPTISSVPTLITTLTPTVAPTIGTSLYNYGKDIASGTLALVGLQTQILFGLASVAGSLYLIHQNSKKRQRS